VGRVSVCRTRSTCSERRLGVRRVRRGVGEAWRPEPPRFITHHARGRREVCGDHDRSSEGHRGTGGAVVSDPRRDLRSASQGKGADPHRIKSGSRNFERDDVGAAIAAHRANAGLGGRLVDIAPAGATQERRREGGNERTKGVKPANLMSAPSPRGIHSATDDDFGRSRRLTGSSKPSMRSWSRSRPMVRSRDRQRDPPSSLPTPGIPLRSVAEAAWWASRSVSGAPTSSNSAARAT